MIGLVGLVCLLVGFALGRVKASKLHDELLVARAKIIGLEQKLALKKK